MKPPGAWRATAPASRKSWLPAAWPIQRRAYSVACTARNHGAKTPLEETQIAPCEARLLNLGAPAADTTGGAKRAGDRRDHEFRAEGHGWVRGRNTRDRPDRAGHFVHDSRGPLVARADAGASGTAGTIRNRRQRRPADRHRGCAAGGRLRARLPGAQRGLCLEGTFTRAGRRHPRARRRRLARVSGGNGVTLDLTQFHETFFAESFE